MKIKHQKKDPLLQAQLDKLTAQAIRNKPLIHVKKFKGPKPSNKKVIQTFTADDTDTETVHYYPKSEKERQEFINPVTNKKITEFQYKVYDLCAQVPRGQVTSYKCITDKLNSNPRAVGAALRLNPFWPLPVPCHRVISSDGSIGGFMGGLGDCQLVANKKAKLISEGNVFDEGYNFQMNALKKKEMFKDFI